MLWYNALPPCCDLELYPSRQLLLGLGVGHGLACVAVSVAPLPPLAALALLLLLEFSWGFYFFGLGLPSNPGFIHRLECRQGQWFIHLGHAPPHSAELLDGFCQYPLMSLHFRLASGKRFWVAVWPDSASVEAQRQLRVVLRSVLLYSR